MLYNVKILLIFDHDNLVFVVCNSKSPRVLTGYVVQIRPTPISHSSSAVCWTSMILIKISVVNEAFIVEEAKI